MSDWPPKPENQPDQPSAQQPKQSLNSQNSVGPEWKILEKAVLASIEEQRRSRRWGIFFKTITFLYVLLLLAIFIRGCSTSAPSGAPDSSVDHIAMVDIVGTIAANKKSVNSEATSKALTRAFEAKNSKAIVLNINSPGGSPVEADEIWQEIRYLKKQYPEKKVYAVIGEVGASAAYYIASAADEILVNPSSLVGSIGVILPNYKVTGLMQKIGVEDRTFTAGSNKDILSPSKSMTASQEQHVQELLDNVHDHFINAVKEGRGDRLKSNDPAIFSGLFWTGDQAIKLGIADRTGSLVTLKRELKIDEAVDYTIEQDSFEKLLNYVGAEVGQGISQSISDQIKAEQQTKLQ